MHVAPVSQSRQQQDYYTHRENKHAAGEAIFYVSQGCMQEILKLRRFESKRKSSQYLTPKTPPLHWWDWWYLQWSGLCNICLCSMDCYMSSMEVPAKQKLQCFFPTWTYLGMLLFFFFTHIAGYNSSLADMTTLTLCWFWLFVNHVSACCNTYSGECVVQVVNGPRNDYNVVNVKPEGQDSCCKAHTYHTELNYHWICVVCGLYKSW